MADQTTATSNAERPWSRLGAAAVAKAVSAAAAATESAVPRLVPASGRAYATSSLHLAMAALGKLPGDLVLVEGQAGSKRRRVLALRADIPDRFGADSLVGWRLDDLRVATPEDADRADLHVVAHLMCEGIIREAVILPGGGIGIVLDDYCRSDAHSTPAVDGETHG